MTDERLEQIIGNLLRAGVTAAAVLMLTGGLWYLARHGESAPEYGNFVPRPWGWSSLASLTHPRPRTILEAGLLLLIATPVARVIFSLVAFALQRDRTYVVITIVVLAVLLYSLAPL